jgi:hypothetical protein
MPVRRAHRSKLAVVSATAAQPSTSAGRPRARADVAAVADSAGPVSVCVFAVFTALLLLIAWPAAAFDLEIAVLQGDAAPPPAPGGTAYRTVRLPGGGDAAGQATAFRAKISGPSGSEKGIFVADPVAAGSTVVTRNDLTSDMRAFRTFSRPSINAAGTVVWRSRVTGSYGEGLFRSGLVDVARRGDPVPTLVTGTLDEFSLPEITDAGDVIFRATIDDADVLGSGLAVDDGIFRCSGADGDCHGGTGTMSALALVGDAVPDRAGREFCSFSTGVSASAWGVAFRAATKDDCTDSGEQTRQGVFRVQFGHLIETVALAGESADTVSGAPGATYYLFRDPPAIEDDGIVAFHGSSTGSGEEDALFTCDPAGALPCPANAAEARFASGGTDVDGDVVRRIASPDISDNGRVVFLASVRGATVRGRGIFALDAGSTTPEPVAVKHGLVGDPDYAGATFGRVEIPVATPGGRIVFAAKIKNPRGRTIVVGE